MNSEQSNNVAEALFAIAVSLDGVAAALRALGTNNAATEMGALELVAKELKEGLEGVASAIGEQ